MGGSEPPAEQNASTGSGHSAQRIAIAGSPRLAEEPAFGALIVFVPLNETPSDAWLQHFRATRLPGHAHRKADSGLVFNLDRNDQDVAHVMRDIAAAIVKSNEDSVTLAEADEKAAIKWDSAMKSKREKIDKRLAEWWEQEGASA
jgi:hypothetical protein